MKPIHYLVVALISCSSALATAAPDAGPTTTVQPEDAKHLREQVDTLGQMFGVQKAPAVAQPGQEPPHKTPADVADRALTLFSGAMAQVASSIEKVAPSLIRVMIKQQYAKAARNLVDPLGAIFIALIAGWFLRRIWAAPEDHESGEYAAYVSFARVIPVGLALCFGIWFVGNLSESAAYLLNPEFYAIKDLITMVLNPGSIQ